MSIKNLEIKNLVCLNREKNKIILENISYKFPLKKITAIIGKPGSGKSLLLKHLNALLIPESGSVTLDDITWSKKRKIKNIKTLRQKTGCVFQFSDKQLFEETVEKDILFSTINYNLDVEKTKLKILEYFEYLSLNKEYLKKSPFELSGGEKKKISIIGSIAHNPDLILFDEIANGLDTESTAKIIKLIKDLSVKFKKTIVFTTNDMNMVKYLADNIIVLKDKKIVKVTTSEELFFNTKLVKKLGLSVPKTIQFLKKLEKNNFDISDLKVFSSENELINKIIRKIKK